MPNNVINKVVYGDRTLIDLTDTTATAETILSGYGAYGADGVWMNGTATAGGSVTQDQDGFIVLPSTGGGGGGGDGLVFEQGTWTPSEDVSQTTINFATTHDTCPAYVLISDTSGADTTPTYTAYSWAYVNFASTFGSGIPNGTTDFRYGFVAYARRTTGSAAPSLVTTMLSTDTSSAESSVTSAARYWVNESWFKPYCNNASVMWRSGRTYKWIAIWKPTT